jgi:hypothetical protein
MLNQGENAKLFQKMVVFTYVEDTIWKQTKGILVNRGTVEQYDVC